MCTVTHLEKDESSCTRLATPRNPGIYNSPILNSDIQVRELTQAHKDLLEILTTFIKKDPLKKKGEVLKGRSMCLSMRDH